MPHGSVESLLEQADQLLEDGEPAEAFELYDSAADADPSDPSVLLRAGAALLQAGAPREAYHYFEQVQHARPGDPEVSRLMGVAALAEGQGSFARSALESAVDAGEPQTVDLLMELAAAAYWDLDIEASREYAQRAADVAPGDAEPGRWIARLDGLEDDHAFLVQVARDHCRSGRLGMGWELFRVALGLGDSFEVRLYGGRALWALGRLREARELLLAAVAERPDDSSAAADLAALTSILDEVVDESSAERPAREPARSARSTAAAPRFCSRCGGSLRATSAFCPQCGTPVARR